jgi:hypothetical protein
MISPIIALRAAGIKQGGKRFRVRRDSNFTRAVPVSLTPVWRRRYIRLGIGGKDGAGPI